jgi:hypothetical protein
MRAKIARYLPLGIYSALTLSVLLPMLSSGYILTLDMVFTPELPLPETITNSYAFRASLHYLNYVVPSELLQKLILVSILLFSTMGMHRLINHLQPFTKGQQWQAYIASIFFAVNPFTYSRFMAGHYALLLGYALLPWFVRLLIDFGRLPSLKTALKLAGLSIVITVVSIHTIGALVLLIAAATVIGLWRFRQHAKNYIRYGLIAVMIFLIGSCYWLVPPLLGQGTTYGIISQFTAADTEAFATTGQNSLIRLGNIARLQGFWAERHDLYLLPQDRVGLWGLLAIGLLTLVTWGGAVLWRTRKTIFILFVSSGLGAALLAAGAVEPLAQLIPWLSGYREPHKLVGLVALCYSVLLAFGVRALLVKVQQAPAVAKGCVLVTLVLLPLLLSRTMLWGFDGQLTPRHYPKDWFFVNQQLQQDGDTFGVLFLPWHQYMSFRFAGRIIANPAPLFFSKTTYASADPELGGATSGRATDRHNALDSIIMSLPDTQNFAERLASQNIKYILLAKELDYKKYNLQNQPHLKVVDDYPTISVYHNQAWREQ